MRQTISVVFAVKNEEERLPGFLTQFSWVNEKIAIINAATTDRSAEICQAYGCKVFKRKLDGNFTQQAAFGVSKVTSDWVLSVACDEFVDDKLKIGILDVLQNNVSYAAYRFNRINYFIDQPLRYGAGSEDCLRFFRRDKGQFTGDSLHDRLIIDGPIGHLNGELHHLAFNTIYDYIERHNFYSEYEVNDFYQKHGTLSDKAFRKIFIRRPLKIFVKDYIKRKGYKDGVRGLVFAILVLTDNFIRLAKYWERYIIKNPKRRIDVANF